MDFTRAKVFGSIFAGGLWVTAILGCACVDRGPLDGGERDAGSLTDAGVDGGPPDGGGLDAGHLTEVPLEACWPRVYAARVAVGGTTFSLLLDTGSATTAVVGHDCPSCIAAGAGPGYLPGATARNENQTVEAMFGAIAPSGWKGAVFTDEVGPAPATPMRFVSIQEQSQFIVGTCGTVGKPPQGLVGMQPAKSAHQGTDSFIDTVIAHHKVPNVFSVRLCERRGSVWLGGIEPSSVAGEVAYTPMWPPGFSDYVYTVSWWSMAVDGQEVAIPTGEYVAAYLDTGSDHTSIPVAALSALATKLAAHPQFQAAFGSSAATFFDNPSRCVSTTKTKAELDDSLPAMILTLGATEGSRIQVTAKPTESYLLKSDDGRWCPAIVARAPSPNFQSIAAIVGAPLLRSNVVIYDREQKRVGFAPAAPCGD